MPDIDQPLSENDFNEIVRGIEVADKTLKAINRAVSAGVDCGERLAETRAKREQLLALKRTYFPGR